MIKKIFRYVIILLLLLLGLCAIGLLFLFFVPNSSIFGITYIGREPSEITTLDYDIKNVSTIEVNSKSFNVNVVQSSSTDKISVYVYNNMFGYGLKKNSKANVQTKLYSSKLTFTISEPSGFAYKNTSHIELRIPKNTSANAVNVVLNNKSASTVIDCKDVNINNLKYTTNSGTLNLSNGKVLGNINLTLNRADCYFNKDISLNNNNLTFSQTYGDLYTDEKTVLGNVTQLSNDTGSVNIATCAKYTAKLGSAGGRINLGKCTDEVNITSTDTHVKIDEALSTVTIELSKSGSVTMGTLQANSNANASRITTNNGKIEIGTSHKYLRLISNGGGNIEVKNQFVAIDATSESGNITINYSQKAGNYPDESNGSKYRDVTVNTKNGNVKVTGAQHIKLQITGKGDAEVVMNKVYEKDNKIAVGSGNVKVTLPSIKGLTAEQLNQFYLTAKSTNNGKVSVNVAGSMSDINKKSWEGAIGIPFYQEKPQKDSMANQLLITSTSGNIVIVD